ncbi:MAG: HEAT repeat domain-containing protein [Gemmataceae bacterium]
MHRHRFLFALLSILSICWVSGWDGSPAHGKIVLPIKQSPGQSFTDTLYSIPTTKANVRKMMTGRLWSVQQSDIPRLIQAVSHPYWRIRFWALIALAKLGPDADEAVPVVTRALQDRDADVRATAAFTLGCLGPKAKSALFALYRTARDTNPNVQFLAITTCQKLDGLQNEEGFRVLIDQLGSANSEVRALVEKILPDLAQPEYIPPLLEELKTHTDFTMRARILNALKVLGPKAKKATGTLLTYLNSKTLPEQTVLATLGTVGAGDPKVIATLNQYLQQNLQQARVRTNSSYYYNIQAALKALAHSGPKAKVALPGMLEALRIREPIRSSRYLMVRIYAAKALGALGAEAKTAVQSIKQGLTRNSFQYMTGGIDGNKSARKALVLILPEDRQIFEAYVNGLGPKVSDQADLAETLKLIAPRLVLSMTNDLKSPNVTTRKKAEQVLSKLGPLAKKSVPTLKQMLEKKDTSTEVRQSVTRVLQNIGPEAEPALPQLLQSLRFPDIQVQMAAAKALGKIGKKPEKVVPGLLALIKDKDTRIATVAAEALRTFVDQDDKIVPVLLKVLKANDSRLQLAVLNCLSQAKIVGKEAVPLLVRVGTQAGTPSIAKESARLINRITRELNFTPPEILRLAKLPDNDDKNQLAAIALGGQNKVSVETLRRLLRESQAAVVRMAAIDSLAEMEIVGRTAEPELLDALRDPYKPIQAKAAEALAKLLGPEAKQARAFWLGRLLSTGQYVPTDATIWRKLDPKGSEHFYTGLTRAYQGVKNYEQQISSLEQALQATNPSTYTYHRLGALYYQKQDYQKSASLFEQAAERGYSPAQFYLGLQYFRGYGVPQDRKQAVKWYTLAARQNNSDAMNSLGFAYYQGAGISKDLAQALQWFKKSADYGNKVGRYNLGLLYRTGKGVPKNDAAAFKYLQQSASQRYPKAENLLGEMYRLGQGTTKNTATAVMWYRRAAEQGYSVGQYNLGQMYDNGWGVPRDYEKAFTWFRRAADQNYPPAQSVVARMYSRARGVKRDYAKALAWYRKAASEGDPRFLNALAFFQATCPDEKFRNGKVALKLALQACDKTKYQDPSIIDTLAAAYAESGDFKNAVKFQHQAIDHPKAQTNAALEQEFRERLKLYQKEKPYRESVEESKQK